MTLKLDRDEVVKSFSRKKCFYSTWCVFRYSFPSYAPVWAQSLHSYLYAVFLQVSTTRNINFGAGGMYSFTREVASHTHELFYFIYMGSHWVPMPDIKLSLSTWLDLNSQRPAYLCLLGLRVWAPILRQLNFFKFFIDICFFKMNLPKLPWIWGVA